MKYNSWETVRLGDVCDYENSRVSIAMLDDDNYISTENMQPNKGGVCRASSLPSVSAATKFLNGQTLVSNIRPYFKKIWFADKDGGCSNDVLCFRLNKDINNKYFYYLLSQDSFFDYVMSGSKGTKMPRGDRGQIMQFEFMLPSLEEQERIAEILGALDDKIECNNRIKRNLEEQAAVLFRRWFVDFEFPDSDGNPYRSFSGEMIDSPLGKIPKEWKVGKLEDFIDFFNGYAFKSSELIDTQPAADYLDVFKMGHIKKGGGFNMEGTKSWINKLQSKGLERYILQKGDLLMCMTDMKSNVALLGHTALMSVDGKYIVNQRVGLLKSKNRIGIDYPYLYILTNSDDFITDLRSRANSGVQVNLSTSEIKLSKVVIAPNNINICFDNIAKPLFEKVFILEDENRTLAELRDTLLPKLMNNEIKAICQ